MTAVATLPPLADVAAELARRSLLDFTCVTHPEYEVNWHHEVLASTLDDVLEGREQFVMVFMPPQNGKSELVSRRFPAYALGKQPRLRIVSGSYNQDLADSMGADVQNIMRTEEYQRIFPKTRLASVARAQGETGAATRVKQTITEFKLVGARGGYRACGVDTSLTGRTADIGIIDDPVKNRKEAESKTFRDNVWDWFKSTFSTRFFGAGGRIILLMTRWHQDDLAGRLLKLAAENPDAPQWKVIRFPAIAVADNQPHDPRKKGEALWPAKYPLDELRRRKATSGTYDWNAIYQQNPTPSEGTIFKREWFEIVLGMPATSRRCRAWDKAGTEGDGDYSAGVRLSMTNDSIVYVEDVTRGQWSSGARNKIMKQTADLDAQQFGIGVVTQRIEKEPGSGGKESAEISVTQLAGHTVKTMPSVEDKVTRARPFAAQCEAGNVRIVAGPWNAEYINELCDFPNGEHDDQVDGSSDAFNELTLGSSGAYRLKVIGA